MSQHGPRKLANSFGGTTDFFHAGFTEPGLELDREIVNSEIISLIFVFDSYDLKKDPERIALAVTEEELSRAADEYIRENHLSTEGSN